MGFDLTRIDLRGDAAVRDDVSSIGELQGERSLLFNE
jgi:hypothetical protein